MKTRCRQPLWRVTALAWLTLSLTGCQLSPTLPDCPAGQTLDADQLHGSWTLQLAGASGPWRLQLGPHPEHLGSLRGELTQGSARHPVVADLDGRDFTMEESHDGQRIAATWLGTAIPGHCGRLIQGVRQEQNQTAQDFTMRLDR